MRSSHGAIGLIQVDVIILPRASAPEIPAGEYQGQEADGAHGYTDADVDVAVRVAACVVLCDVEVEMDEEVGDEEQPGDAFLVEDNEEIEDDGEEVDVMEPTFQPAWPVSPRTRYLDAFQ
jgi:hypothetical protein